MVSSPDVQKDFWAASMPGGGCRPWIYSGSPTAIFHLCWVPVVTKAPFFFIALGNSVACCQTQTQPRSARKLTHRGFSTLLPFGAGAPIKLCSLQGLVSPVPSGVLPKGSTALSSWVTLTALVPETSHSSGHFTCAAARTITCLTLSLLHMTVTSILKFMLIQE